MVTGKWGGGKRIRDEEERNEALGFEGVGGWGNQKDVGGYFMLV